MSSGRKMRVEPASLGSLEGILVGHATGASTGVTVVLCPEGATVGVDVRGGASGTRELDPCRPGHLVERAHGICLAGGSAFGLAAAGGVMRFLEERGAGFPTSAGPVPIVPSAILYDLGLGDPRERPDEAMGYAACEAAGRDPAEGTVGAGTGATVGKLLGRERATKGGVGIAAARAGPLQVATVAVVNAFGDIVDPAGRVVAGPRLPEGGFADSAAELARGATAPGFGGGQPPDPSTTLVVVITNAALDKAGACRLAAAGSLGVTRTVRPVHTRFDGDVVFALSTGRVQALPEQVGALTSDQVAEAILRAVRAARGLGGVPAASEV